MYFVIGVSAQDRPNVLSGGCSCLASQTSVVSFLRSKRVGLILFFNLFTIATPLVFGVCFSRQRSKILVFGLRSRRKSPPRFKRNVPLWGSLHETFQDICGKTGGGPEFIGIVRPPPNHSPAANTTPVTGRRPRTPRGPPGSAAKVAVAADGFSPRPAPPITYVPARVGAARAASAGRDGGDSDATAAVTSETRS